MNRRRVTDTATRALYRRCLRAAEYCVDDHRDMMMTYVRVRFRDNALATSSSSALTRCLREGEDELKRFMRTLQAAGRLPDPQSITDPPSAEPVNVGVSPSGGLLNTRRWTEAAVQEWLRGLGLDEHIAAFARHRVDGALLFQLDDEDLAHELGVTSRLQRKRILSRIGELKSADADNHPER
jgi:hypothetical protein